MSKRKKVHIAGRQRAVDQGIPAGIRREQLGGGDGIVELCFRHGTVRVDHRGIELIGVHGLVVEASNLHEHIARLIDHRACDHGTQSRSIVIIKFQKRLVVAVNCQRGIVVQNGQLGVRIREDQIPKVGSADLPVVIRVQDIGHGADIGLIDGRRAQVGQSPSVARGLVFTESGIRQAQETELRVINSAPSTKEAGSQSFVTLDDAVRNAEQATVVNAAPGIDGRVINQVHVIERERIEIAQAFDPAAIAEDREPIADGEIRETHLIEKPGGKPRIHQEHLGLPAAADGDVPINASIDEDVIGDESRPRERIELNRPTRN